MRTKTKRRLLFSLLTAGCCTLAAGALCACKIGQGNLADDINKYNLTATVYYYANGGSFGLQEASLKEREFHFTAGSPIFDLGHKQGDPTEAIVQRYGYDFTGWHYASVDEDGNVVRVADGEKGDGKVVDSGTAVTFPTCVEENKSYYLCATWKKQSWLNYVFVPEDFDDPSAAVTGTAKVPDDNNVYTEKTVGRNDRIYYTPFGEHNELSVMDGGFPAVSGCTYLAVYSDAACTTLINGTKVAKPAAPASSDQPNEDVTVYAKFLKGNWLVVKSPSDVKKMLSNGAEGACSYVFKDIACSASDKFTLKGGASFNGRIEGNGHTISGISTDVLGQSIGALRDSSPYSLFGKVGAKAKLHNVTFANITLTATVKNGTGYLAAFFNTIETGAQFTGVTIDTCNINFTIPRENCTVHNITGTDSTHVLFGDKDTTDSALASTFGITVTGTQNLQITRK